MIHATKRWKETGRLDQPSEKPSKRPRNLVIFHQKKTKQNKKNNKKTRGKRRGTKRKLAKIGIAPVKPVERFRKRTRARCFLLVKTNKKRDFFSEIKWRFQLDSFARFPFQVRHSIRYVFISSAFQMFLKDFPKVVWLGLSRFQRFKWSFGGCQWSFRLLSLLKVC